MRFGDHEPERHATPADPRSYLERLGRDQLIEMVLDAAGRDEVLSTRIAAAAADPDSPELLRGVLFDAIVPSGHVSYREAYDYGQAVDAVLDRVEAFLEAGHPELVVDLTEYAVDCAERAVGYLDDSDGQLGMLTDRLVDLHLAACEEIRPDPRQLARRLHGMQAKGGELEAFYGAVPRYADLLGEVGLTVYRDLVEQEWSALPEPAAPFDAARSRIVSTLEELAALSGDLAAEVEAMSRDLSSAHRFVRISQRYQRDERHDDALRWALRGIGAHGTSDPTLVEVAAEEHHRAGHGAAAVDLLRSALDDAPTMANYQRLAGHARRAGTWAEHRDGALDRLRAEVARREPPRYRWQPPADASLLVDVLLWEGDPDGAWAEAKQGGCSGPTVMRLARACRDRRPTEVIPLYQREIESVVAVKDKQAYAEAVALLGEVEGLFSAAGDTDGFAEYVAGVRRAHRAKRNLMTLLAARGW